MNIVNKVKSIAILLSLLVLPFNANAAGPYDGVGELIVPGYGGLYGAVYQTGDTIVMISLDANDSSWAVYMGQIQGSQVELSTVFTDHGTNLVYLVNFTSAGTGDLTQISCTPVAVCNDRELPNNVTFAFVNIF